jgi:hypothetical protein
MVDGKETLEPHRTPRSATSRRPGMVAMMDAKPELWVYVSDCTLDEALGWLRAVFLDLYPSLTSAPLCIFEGNYCGDPVTVALRTSVPVPSGFLEIEIDAPGSWPSRADLAHAAFAALQRAVAWVPDGKHAPGELLVLDASGERLVDRAELAR